MYWIIFNIVFRNLGYIPSPVLLSGTQIWWGEGLWALVIAVGDNSSYGRIKNSINHQVKEKQPIKEFLSLIEIKFIILGAIAAGIAILSILLRMFINYWIGGSNADKNSSLGLQQYLDFMMLFLTIFVIAIPLSLSLSFLVLSVKTVKSLLVDWNLVRDTSWLEKLGKINCILTDKTGTLTRNELYVTNVWWDKDIPIDSNKSQFSADLIIKHDHSRKLLIEGLAWNLVGDIGSCDKINGWYFRLQLYRRVIKYKDDQLLINDKIK